MKIGNHCTGKIYVSHLGNILGLFDTTAEAYKFAGISIEDDTPFDEPQPVSQEEIDQMFNDFELALALGE